MEEKPKVLEKYDDRPLLEFHVMFSEQLPLFLQSPPFYEPFKNFEAFTLSKHGSAKP